MARLSDCVDDGFARKVREMQMPAKQRVCTAPQLLNFSSNVWGALRFW
ncbi:MAG: hypothetical protein GXY06_02315 [Clostridiaceae bacterium]|nr:hypothetical protein [Clostridiaceae bacterium]